MSTIKARRVSLLFLTIIFILLFSLAFVACSNNGSKQQIQPIEEEHIHTYSSSWAYNETNHWHNATCGHNTVSELNAHTFGEWIVDRQPTESATGKRHRICSVCGYTQNETLDQLAHTHNFGATYVYNETYHWQECSCGEKQNISEHLYGSWTIDINPTETTTGSKHRTCSVCGNIETEVIPQLDHTHSFSEEYESNDTHHWQSCSGCDEKRNYAEHTFGEWVIDTPATEDSEGSKHRTCTVCGKIETEVIPRITYTLYFNINGGESPSYIASKEVSRLSANDFFFDVEKEGFNFRGWIYNGTTVFDERGNLINSVEMRTNMTFIASYVNTARLTLKSNNIDAGVLSGGGDFEYNTNVTINAQPYKGYNFVGWYNNDILLSNQTEYNYQMWDKDVTIAAKFELALFNLSVESNNSNYGKVVINPTEYKVYVADDDDDILYTQSVTISAYTESTVRFLGWFDDDGALVTTNAVYTFAMPNYDYHLIAKWNYFTINYDLDGGIQNENNPTSYAVESGVVALYAPTRVQREFVGWQYNDEILTTINANWMDNISLKAIWTYYTLTTNTNLQGAGSYTQKDAEIVTSGTNFTLEASTNVGYTWLGWYEGDTLVSDKLNYSLAMPKESKTYTAKWTYYTLTTNTNLEGAGSYTQKSNEKTTSGTDVTLQASTNIGYTWLGWYEGDTLVSDKLNYSFKMPKESKTYTAKWTSYTLTTNTNLDGAGSYTQITDEIVTSGTNVTLEANTNAGYTWLGWYEGDTFLSPELTYSFDMPRQNLTCTAKWQSPAGFENYYFDYDGESYTITGVRDKTVKSAIIPDNVLNIESGAFAGCSSLVSMTLPFAGGSKMATSASYSTLFGYIFGRNSYDGGVATEQSYYVNSNWRDITYYIPSSLRSVTITGDVLSYAFSGCSMFKSVTISDSVTSIGSGAFYSCDLTSIYYTGDVTGWCAINGLSGICYMASNSTLYINGEEVTGDLVIPNGVTNIGGYAFYNRRGLTSVTIPDSVTSIGGGAFYNCSGLTSVTIPDSVTTIGDRAFYYCTNLTSITIPDSVTSIGARAFNNCSGLTSVTIPNSVTNIGDYAFYYCTNLTSITIPDSVTSIGGSAFSGCSGLISIYYTGDIEEWCISGLGNIMSSGITLYINGEEVTGDFVIPNGVPSIGDCAFSYCTGLTSVTIPNSVTSIGSHAFYYCTKLTSVTISNSVTSIGGYAFRGCTGLTSVTIPDSVTNIGTYAFCDCTGLLSVSIGNGVTNIENAAFSGCIGIPTITIPNSVTNIGTYVFCGCTSLTSVTIGDNLTSINEGTFSGCTGLMSVTISDSVTTIGDYAFNYCTNLTSITIPSNVTSIGQNVFCNCIGLTSVILLDGVTSIGQYAFKNCRGLTTITIPDSVISIGYYVFAGCSSLVSMTLPFVGRSKTSNGLFGDIFAWDSYDGGFLITQYSSNAYSSSHYIPSSLRSVTVTGGNISYGAFYGCFMLASITLPNDITSIGEYAFYNCTSLMSLTIPNSVKSIGSNAFNGCLKLVEVCNKSSLSISLGATGYGYVGYYAKNIYKTEDGSKLSTDENGYVIYTDGDDRILVGYFGNATDLTLPCDITEIYRYAFYKNRNLTTITIPISVTKIGKAVFEGCSSLESITIPFVGGSPKTSSDTWQYPFGYIFGTNSYTGGQETRQFFYTSSTTSAKSDIYYIPSSLRSVTVTGGNILYGAFYNCSMLTSVTIGNSVTSINNNAFIGCTDLSTIIVDGENTYYDSKNGCNAIIESASNTLVVGCINTIIPNSITTIGDYAFYYCINLTSITIPDSVTSIGACAFYNCTGLTSVTIPDSVTSIGRSAFSNCTGLTSVTISDSVTTIGDYAFYYCTNLTSITIPNSVTNIGDYAFSNCSGLTSINFDGTTAQWNAISKGNHWNEYTGNYTIHCTDGDINK